MPDLFNVTLLCVETRSPSLALWAMRRCLDQVRFAKAVLITDLAIDYIYPIDIEIIAAPPITKVDDYSLYILSNLIPLIKGTHVLIMQWDSFITNPQSCVDIRQCKVKKSIKGTLKINVFALIIDYYLKMNLV